MTNLHRPDDEDLRVQLEDGLKESKIVTNAELKQIQKYDGSDNSAIRAEQRLASALLADREAFKTLHDAHCECLPHLQDCEAAALIRAWEKK